ncbi:MAG: ABC transporter permease [Acidimicrobiia bacterium]
MCTGRRSGVTRTSSWSPTTCCSTSTPPAPDRASTSGRSPFLVSAITVLTMLSALVLIANTMGTLIAEQLPQIAVMRAIGAGRRAIARIYTTTTLLLAVAGTLAGLLLGLLLSNVMAGEFGSVFWAIDVPWGIDPTVVGSSIALGLTLPVLASLPAIRRGSRMDLRQALDARGPTWDRMAASTEPCATSGDFRARPSPGCATWAGVGLR